MTAWEEYQLKIIPESS